MLEVKVQSAALDAQLSKLAGNVKQRQKLARKLAGEVLKIARRNIRQQIKVEGTAFEKRKKARGKRKMLLGLGKLLQVRSLAASGGGAVVGWKNPLTSAIAYRHQHGESESWDPAKLAREKKQVDPNHTRPCTAKQARALIKEGYRRPHWNKKGEVSLKRVSSSWLQKNMKSGQAGLILRAMRTGSVKGKQEWQVEVPARIFLGLNEAQSSELVNGVAQNFLNSIGAK